MLFIKAALLLFVLIIIPQCLSHSNIDVESSSPNVTFALVGSFSRPALLHMSQHLEAGLRAAFAEANENSKLQYTLAIGDHSYTAKGAVDETIRLASQVFGFVGFIGSGTLQASLPHMEQGTPVIDPITGAQFARWNSQLGSAPTNRILNIRPAYYDEVGALMHELASNWKHLSRTAIIYQSDRFGSFVPLTLDNNYFSFFFFTDLYCFELYFDQLNTTELCPPLLLK